MRQVLFSIETHIGQLVSVLEGHTKNGVERLFHQTSVYVNDKRGLFVASQKTKLDVKKGAMTGDDIDWSYLLITQHVTLGKAYKLFESQVFHLQNKKL